MEVDEYTLKQNSGRSSLGYDVGPHESNEDTDKIR